MSSVRVSIIGMGIVGNAMYKSFREKRVSVMGYDKYKKSDKFEDCLKSDIMFLCLPTLFNEKTMEYDKSSIIETCELLKNHKYNGIIVLKSTVEPTTTQNLSDKYDTLNFIHNPEFLSANTAYDDFHNQTHIVLGKTKNITESKMNIVNDFYKEYYPNASISICKSTESECMKIYLNCFYSVKIQFFNELYLLTNKIESDYNRIVELMLKNKWINPMHTKVPGTDGKLSYGGFCFPKDTNALLNFMKKNDVPCEVLDATVKEQKKMRNDDK